MVRLIGSNACGRAEDGYKEEIVRQFLFYCLKWNHLPREITEVIGVQYGDLSYTLGGRSSETLLDSQPVDKLESLKPNLTVARAILRFVVGTGRLGNATER
jgi:hypothetical protein